MTVRITKPEFNLRKKLLELDKPVGLHGNEILKSETSQDTFDLVGTGRKNMVINGDMRISQRYNTNENTPTNNKYTLDQMRWDLSQSSKFKVQQVTDAPTGFSHSMKVTSLAATSPGSTDYFLVQNFIEGKNSARLKWGTSEAQPVTLSFYVKSSITGVHACGIRNRAYNRSIVQKYIINHANTWEYKTVTFPGCTDGTWEIGIHAGLKINFDIGSGSNFEASPGNWVAAPDFITSDSVKVVGTNGATWYITGIQLESGSLATPFEHRSFGEELALCERYFQSNFPLFVPPQNAYYTTTSDLAAGFNGVVSFSSNNARSPWVMFNQKMNHQPDVTLYSASTSDDANKWSAYKGSWDSGSSNTIDYFGNQGFGVRYGSGGHAFVTGEAYLYRGMWAADAEMPT